MSINNITQNPVEFFHVYGIRFYGIESGDCDEVLLCTLAGEQAAIDYINMRRQSSGAEYDDFYFVKATSRFVSF